MSNFPFYNLPWYFTHFGSSWDIFYLGGFIFESWGEHLVMIRGYFWLSTRELLLLGQPVQGKHPTHYSVYSPVPLLRNFQERIYEVIWKLKSLRAKIISDFCLLMQLVYLFSVQYTEENIFLLCNIWKLSQPEATA